MICGPKSPYMIYNHPRISRLNVHPVVHRARRAANESIRTRREQRKPYSRLIAILAYIAGLLGLR